MSVQGFSGGKRAQEASAGTANLGFLPGLPSLGHAPRVSPYDFTSIGARLRSWFGKRPAAIAYRTVGKRALDILLVILALPVVLPVIAVFALIVVADGGPAFYRQTRIGKGGRSFGCLKLRSMAVDSDRLLKEILETDSAAREEWMATQKLSNDPRITRFGSFMRTTSLDELPQLLNVLMGDMSLVGPRPVVPGELERYGQNADHYLRLRPGLTGAWQVSKRNATSYDERVQMDMDYEQKLSFFWDIWIMARTFGVVFAATGK